MNTLIQFSRKFFFMGLFILFFAGCINNTETTEMQTIDIKSLQYKAYSVEDMIEEGDVIEFDQKDKILSGGCEIICVNDHGFFILDKNMHKQVLLFNGEGRYIRTIGKTGAGPGEYSTLNDAIVIDDKIEILSSAGNVRIFEYSLDGQYKSYKEISIPAAFSFEMDPVNNYYLYYVGHNPAADGRLLLYNIEYQKIYQSFFEPNKEMPPSEINTFYKNEEGNIYYWEAMDNYIYQILPGGRIHKMFYLDWGNKQPLNEMPFQEFSRIMSTQEVWFIKNAIIADDYKLFSIVKSRPGSPPELLEILISGNTIYPFKNVSDENFRISPAQTIIGNKIIYLVEPLNDSFTGDDRYKDFSGYMFCLKVDIKKLINGF